MGQARLTRIDAVLEMAAAVDAFRDEAAAALETLDMEIRRALEWIHNDRHDHWDHQVRRGWENITAARVQLQQAMTARRIGEHDPACIDEKKALTRAKQRLEIAQKKVEAVRQSARAIDRAVDEYRGARTPLASWLESEAPKARAALRRMMDNLEDYLARQVPGGGSAGGGGELGMAEKGRKGEGEKGIPDNVATEHKASGTPTSPPSPLTQDSAPAPPLPFSLSPSLPAAAAVNPDTNSPANPSGGDP